MEASRSTFGATAEHIIHLAPGYVLQFLCSTEPTAHTYYPKPELLGPGKTVLPELNAKMPWSPLEVGHRG